MLVERWDIFPRRMVNNLYNAIRMNNGIMDDTRTPSVTPFYAREINSVAFLHLTNKYAITNKHGVHGVV